MAGDLETVTPAGQQTQAIGHNDQSLGGVVLSLMTFRERTIDVVVMPNISHANTSVLAQKVAEAFAE